MGFFEIMYGMLFQPVGTLRALREEKPVALGLLTFFLVSAVSLLFKKALYTLILPSYLLNLVQKTGWLFSGISLLSAVIMLLVMTGVLSLLSELLYHKGNGPGLLCCLSFCIIPGVLGPPLYYAGALLGYKGLGWFLSFLVGVWVIILQVLALREALELNTGQAVLLYIMPVLALVVLIGIAVAGIMLAFPVPSLI